MIRRLDEQISILNQFIPEVGFIDERRITREASMVNFRKERWREVG